MKTLQQIRLVLPIEPNREIEAGEAAAELARQAHMGQDGVDEVRLAVIEACINAFEHSGAKDGRVHLRLALLGSGEPERIEIEVRDTGVGFDKGALEEPVRRPAKGTPRKRGWGLRIIRELMDEVDIETNAEGTVVVMSKSVGGRSS